MWRTTTLSILRLFGLLALAFALGTGCRKAAKVPEQKLVIDVTVPCQVLPGPAGVGLGFQDSQLCKPDGMKSALFYGDTIPALFYPDGDQHAFFDRKGAPFPVSNGKVFVPVLRAAGTHWYPFSCWSGYLVCRSSHPTPPWPDNTCTDVRDWQVFDVATLNWTNQADSPSGPLLPLPDVNQAFVCPTPIPPTPTRTRTPSPAPSAPPTAVPPPSPSQARTIAPTPATSPTCPVCPTCQPSVSASQTPVPSQPPPPSATRTPVVVATRTPEPCFPPFCVTPRAKARPSVTATPLANITLTLIPILD